MNIEVEGRKEYERRIFNGFYQFTLGFGIYDLANETEQWTKERKCVCVLRKRENAHYGKSPKRNKEIRLNWVYNVWVFEVRTNELTFRNLTLKPTYYIHLVGFQLIPTSRQTNTPFSCSLCDWFLISNILRKSIDRIYKYM